MRDGLDLLATLDASGGEETHGDGVERSATKRVCAWDEGKRVSVYVAENSDKMVSWDGEKLVNGHWREGVVVPAPDASVPVGATGMIKVQLSDGTTTPAYPYVSKPTADTRPEYKFVYPFARGGFAMARISSTDKFVKVRVVSVGHDLLDTEQAMRGSDTERKDYVQETSHIKTGDKYETQVQVPKGPMGLGGTKIETVTMRRETARIDTQKPLQRRRREAGKEGRGH
jgi:hypothetical protein